MLQLTPNILQTLQKDAADSFPDECCGFFYGNVSDEVKTITRVHPVFNAKEGDKKRRFEISPREYMKAERFADEQGLTLLGVYHSHPQHPAIPSETDRLAAQPVFSYVIIPVYDSVTGIARSWTLNEDNLFDEETILIQ